MKQLKLNATVGEWFGTLIVVGLLTGLTLGIYAPWGMVKIIKFFEDHTTDEQGTKLCHDITGGQLFGNFIKWGLLTAITFGIYGLWVPGKALRFIAKHMWIERNGAKYALIECTKSDISVFGTLFVQQLLCGITLGIYTPWAVANIEKFIVENYFQAEGAAVVEVENAGFVGELVKTFFIGIILTAVTLGIYSFWFHLNMMRVLLGRYELNYKE